MGNAIKRSVRLPGSIGLLWLLVTLSSETLALEGQGSLAPAKIKVIQKTNQSYKECVITAAAAGKAGKLNTQELSAAFALCTEKYPSTGLFNECKRNVLKNAKGRDLTASELTGCKKLQIDATFTPDSVIPIFINGNQSFFAGLGLNRDLKISEMDLPNFTCDRFRDAVTDIPNKAQHILFGNNPKMFLSGAEQSKFINHLKATASKLPKGAKFNDVSGVGRVFGEPTTQQSMIYFPSSSCDYKGVLGQAYAGLSVFYLPDTTTQIATPYFGIAYYRAGQKKQTTPKLVAELLSRLGSSFKAYSKDKSTIFISAAPFQEVDQERDPRNICKAPRPHQFVAVVRTLSADSNVPEYLLLANIRNLCDYGDRLAKKLAN